ncbi:MAG TPA: valine--tRNA ligase [Candidatus Paceibacterota bacterium]|nr:valine--tRNA ligase [Candidatus Paceibacterota bacterium]
MKSLGKIYQPQKEEKKIYRLWEKSGYFNPDNLPKTKKGYFSIIMPPPNANDPLHIGHAVFVSLEDLITRYQRLKGKRTLWLPGTDHAGFETQIVFEKKLEKEGKSRFDFTREEFYQLVYQYTKKNQKTVYQQLKKLGASCDFSRKKFTLDKDIIKIVLNTFEKLYQDGLIYRGERIVNYCPKHQTAFSDLEVKYEEEKGTLFYIQYPLKDGGAVEVATTRPETIFGDMALAINPNDKRYQKLIGKIAIEPLTKREIPIIEDKRVEQDFGTGVLKITPAHDPTDFEIAQDHRLLPRRVIDFQGRLNELAGSLKGLKVLEAREKTIEILKQNNLLIKTEEITHRVGHCYKCHSTIEPMIMNQWFISVNKPFGKEKKSLRDRAIEAVKTKKIKIIPKNFEKNFYHWMKNLKDWNISRQIWWGIPIPVYYCQEQKTEKCQKEKGIIVSQKKLKECPYCHSQNIVKDPDVLDTWFSSGQWPFATLMTAKKGDFEKFYPTDVMETGWDILFFWVARMIMLGIYCTGKIPFKTVYLHGLVRDKDRQKMSKSKGNVIDPLGVIENYGADALRMALIMGTGLGSDIILSEEKIKGFRNFANKVWNASRFVLMNIDDLKKKPNLTKSDQKILKDFQRVIKKVEKHLDNFRFNLAAETIYRYFWFTFADKIIEEMKIRIRENKNKESAQYLLYLILKNSLIILHPFMPFITESVWQSLPEIKGEKKEKMILIEKWPTSL